MAPGRRPRTTGGTADHPARPRPRAALPRRLVRLPRRPARARRVRPHDPGRQSLAIVGQNGAGKTTLAKLLCRLYDPTSGAVEADGIDLRDARPRRLAPARDRRVPGLRALRAVAARQRRAVGGAPDADDRSPRSTAPAPAIVADLDTPLAKGYPGGTDLSGGQWQRVALARALCAVRAGAGVVLLDEPTAQLDVRGEAEIFERILAATRGRTTILVSHRFSTVRQADRICVLEHGAVVELGTHDELMALGGRYRTMFELQASRFVGGRRARRGGRP